MRHLLVLICCLCTLHAHAQHPYAPNDKAKTIHDNAINTYIKYSKNRDSVLFVIRMMDNTLAIDSNYLIAWNNKISFECQLRQYDNALRTAKRMINIFPEEQDLVFLSGVLAFKAGHNDEATAIFEQLIKVYDKTEDANNDPDHLKASALNKGLALKLLGRYDESKKELVNLSMKEHDLTVRRHINRYISMSREDIINEMIAAR